jgi:hypothetical protein
MRSREIDAMKTGRNANRRVAGRAAVAALVAAVAAGTAWVLPARAHHSFAPYNLDVTTVFTGVVTRVNPDANHLQIFFAPMNEERKNVTRDAEGKPVVWAVEMRGSAQSAKEGISVSNFPPGTIFSVALHPLRSGGPAGSRVHSSAMFKCPEKKPPAPGKHCDSVEGHAILGTGPLLAPKEKE